MTSNPAPVQVVRALIVVAECAGLGDLQSKLHKLVEALDPVPDRNEAIYLADDMLATYNLAWKTIESMHKSFADPMQVAKGSDMAQATGQTLAKVRTAAGLAWQAREAVRELRQ
jgi:hypothetical protein